MTLTTDHAKDLQLRGTICPFRALFNSGAMSSDNAPKMYLLELGCVS